MDVVCRNTHPARRRADFTRVLDGNIILPDVHARAANNRGNVGPVVQDETDAARREKIAKFARGSAQICRSRSFVAKLNQFHAAIGNLFGYGEERFGYETGVEDRVECWEQPCLRLLPRYSCEPFQEMCVELPGDEVRVRENSLVQRNGGL